MPSSEALVWARRAFPGLDPTSARPLAPAGSSRMLTRLFHSGGSLVLVENPVPVTDAVNENDAFFYVAVHLGAREIPVPGVLAYKRSRGWMLVEDLGDVDLCAEAHRVLRGPGRDDPGETQRLAALYREALEVLVRLQTDGATGFDPRRTHNPPRYDAELMREGESGYFVRELVVHHLGLAPPPGLDEELDRLAALGAAAGAGCLIHRDYQSQNLKIHLGRVCVIDFQGARLGPPQYDVAALLLDPYADLPEQLRRDLLDHYLALRLARVAEDPARFMEHFPVIAVHRLLQALGAYAFLGRRRGKPAFLAHIPVALRLLEQTLVPLAGQAPLLAALVAEARRSQPRDTAGGGGLGPGP